MWHIKFTNVPEKTNQLQDLINRMRNLHQIILEEYGLEVQCLLRHWKKLHLRASDYKTS